MIRLLNWQWRDSIFKNLKSHFSLRERWRSVASPRLLQRSGGRPRRIPTPGGCSNRGCWWMQQMENQNWQLYSMPIQLHRKMRQNKLLVAWDSFFCQYWKTLILKVNILNVAVMSGDSSKSKPCPVISGYFRSSRGYLSLTSQFLR